MKRAPQHELPELLEAVSPASYLAGDAVGEAYAVDWSGENPRIPPVVLRPGSAEELADVVRRCHAAGQPLAVQGGRTGLVGGATPRPGEWVLSLERLSGVAEVDPDSMTLTAGAGTPLEVMQNAAGEAGLEFPIDLGARGTATAGGLVATNAGGNQVIQRGMTRASVLGLEAVLADGTLLNADNKLAKNNAGFDLKQLFIGSEGTLGIVTQATFRLVPRRGVTVSALCAAAGLEQLIVLLKRLTQVFGQVSAFEAMWGDYFDAAAGAAGVADPFGAPHPLVVLVEVDGNEAQAPREQFEQTLSEALAASTLEDAIVAKNAAEAAEFWKIRDGVSELLPKLAPLANFDVGIPLSAMCDFVEAVRTELGDQFPDMTLFVFGHVADSNLHLVASTGRHEDVGRIYDIVYRITGEYGGSISAEHGIGVLKKPYLAYSRSETELALMRTLKKALDPTNILNPGRVI